jgi:hypothetical protein
MELVKKDVRYLNKDFAQFRQNLINFTRQYFPNTYSDFNESSPGMMFIEMASYVGDVLSYYTDQSFRESLLKTANEDANVLMLSQLFGYKPKLNSAALVTLDIYQLVPSIGFGVNARPDYQYALSIKAGMQVSAPTGATTNRTVFRTIDPVDFSSNTPEDPTEVSVYELDSAGNVLFYLLKKHVQAVSGQIITRDYIFDDPKPYDKITLPEINVLDIISVVDSEGNTWNQTDYLAQDTVFEDIVNIPYNDPDLAIYRSTVPYILKLRKTPRRYVTRIRANYQTELQFGSGISSDADEEIIPNPKNVGLGLNYLARTTNSNIDPSNFLYTSTYGLAPYNTTLTVRYTVGGSVDENISSNVLTIVDSAEYNPNPYNVDLTFTRTTLAVNNPAPAIGGKSRDELESIRQNAMASFAAQNRAITREDYIVRCYSMPVKYGSIAKAYVVADQQVNAYDITYPRETIPNPLALNVYVLAYDANKNFVSPNSALQENLRTYLSNYRMLTDGINIKTAHIINIGIEFEVIPQPNYNSNEIILKCIQRLKTMFDNDRMQINGSINISNVISDLDRLEGVQSIPKLEIHNLYDTTAGYSGNVYNINLATRNNIVYPSLDPCIFEIKHPDTDIIGRAISI